MHVIIQARSTSTRLPNKCMADICGKPLIQRVYDLCTSTIGKDNVVVTIPHYDPLAEYLFDKDIKYFEGSEHNVLKRYYDCAKSINARGIIRITSDCPLLVPSEIFSMIQHFKFNGMDFITNLPCVDGHDTEIMSMRLLEYVYKNAKDNYHLEHVTTYIKDNIKTLPFNCNNRFIMPYLAKWYPKLSIDTQEDLENIRKIYKEIYGK